MGLIKKEQLVTPITVVEKAEDCKSLKSVRRYYDAKLKEFAKAAKKEGNDAYSWVKQNPATEQWYVQINLRQMPVYLDMRETEGTVDIMDVSEDGSKLTSIGARAKEIGLSKMNVDSQQEGVDFLIAFGGPDNKAEFDEVMARAAEGYKEQQEIELPAVKKRLKHLYNEYVKKENISEWGAIDHKDAGTKRSTKKTQKIASLTTTAKSQLGYVRWRVAG